LNVAQKATLKPEFTSVSQSEVDEVVNIDPYFLFRLGYQHFIPLTKKFSLFTDARIIMPSISKIGFNDYVKVGGVAPILYSAMPFWGAARNEVNVTQAATASLGFQWNFYSAFFLKGKVNYLNTRYPMTWLNKVDDVRFNINGNAFDGMFGFGAELAYNSPMGPIRILVHQSQYGDHLNVFVAFGYNIFKSDGDF
jgi:hypothetical protein